MPNPHEEVLSQKNPLGNLRSPVQESRLKVLYSNLCDFLVERPVKVRGAAEGDLFSSSGFGTGVKENFEEFFKPAPRGAVNSRLITNWNMGFSGFWQNVKDLISPPKMPPMETTGEPIPEIWSKNSQFTRVQALSLAFHVVVLALIIGPLLPALLAPPTTKANNTPLTAVTITPYMAPPSVKKAGGGGGARDLTPASRGRAPKFAAQQIAVPISHPVEHPQIAMTPTILGNKDLTPPNINATTWGDPLSHVLGDSMGNGKGTGIGNGNGGGLGNGFENGTGGGYPTAGIGGYGTPSCLYCPNAQFSDEAVKAKYQGTVLVSAIIGADGRVLDAKVVKSLGLGLDENAVAAVKTWRFKPALGPDGKPTAVRQTIEVVFHLY
ncbi:MAG: energy transducer TonB [Candidatus Acidiferrales bacterium]